MKLINKTVFWVLLIFAIIIVAGMSFNMFGGQGFAISSETMFAKPLWARLECAPTDDYEGITKSFSTSGKYNRITCGIDENTNECQLYATVGNTFIAGRFNYCTDNNLDYKCDGETTQIGTPAQREEHFIKTMEKGEKLMFWCENSIGYNVYCEEIVKKYKPWRLYRFVGGAKYEAKANTCKLTDVSGIYGLIPTQQSTPVTELTFTGGDGYKWVNFVSDFAYGPSYNVFKYQGRDVYCTGNAIYEIQTMQMKDGKLVKINPEYNPPNTIPFRIETIGAKIKNVECCSNEPNCDDNFNIVSGKDKQSCFTDAQCSNSGNPIPTSDTTIIEQKCVGDYCEWQTERNVECTRDSSCQSPKVCDKLTYTCITPDPSGYCGDNVCNRDENENTCPADCKGGIGIPTNWLPIMILGIFVLIIILMFVIKRRMSSGGGL